VIKNQKQRDDIFSTITTPLGDELTWRWEDKLSALLTEFSWEKKERFLIILRELFSEEWNKKTIKNAPKIIKDELGDLALLSKEQLLFTRPATATTPALAIIWWPWGHGATYSMRIKILHTDYDNALLQQEKPNFIKKIFQDIFSK
jgi:hypothetical protein